MHYLDEHHIFLFLVQLLILMGCARGLGEVFKKWKQPALTAEILVGILLGPTILGRFLPGVQLALFPPDMIQQNMLETVAWLGVFFLLLDTGLEIDFSIAWRQRSSAFFIALTDIVVPMIISFAAVYFLPARYLIDPQQRLIFSLFMATVMTISALPVAARVLHELNLLKVDLGFLVMSALTVNDIIGWVLFTIILGLFTSVTVAVSSIALLLAGTIGFAALALTLGRNVSTKFFAKVHKSELPEPATSLTITVLLGLLFGTITHKLGIHALFGFFIAGIVVGEAKSVSEQTRGIISQMGHSLFVPLFFANIGIKLDFVAHFDLPLVALITVIGISSRYIGAWLGVTVTRVPRVNRDLIAIAHTPGGMMEIVVALMALEAGLITPQIFVAIVFSAVFSSIIMGPWMMRSMARRAAVSAADYLARESIIARLVTPTREEAVGQLAELIVKRTKALSKSEIAKEAMAREHEFGTALGCGVAIPHFRIQGLHNPVLAYGRAPDGIEWDAPDGKPVHHVFFLATPAGATDLHVQILSSIARALHSADNRQLLDRATDEKELHAVLDKVLATGKK